MLTVFALHLGRSRCSAPSRAYPPHLPTSGSKLYAGAFVGLSWPNAADRSVAAEHFLDNCCVRSTSSVLHPEGLRTNLLGTGPVDDCRICENLARDGFCRVRLLAINASALGCNCHASR